MSDNPDKQEWPTLRWSDAAEVIGEVKWAAREGRRGRGAYGKATSRWERVTSVLISLRSIKSFETRDNAG